MTKRDHGSPERSAISRSGWRMTILLMLGGMAFFLPCAAQDQGLSLSLRCGRPVIAPEREAILEVTVTNHANVPLAFMKPGCYKGHTFTIAFAAGNAIPTPVEMEGGQGDHTVKMGVFTGTVELIEPGKTLVFPVAIYLSPKRRLLFEGHGSFASTGYFPGQEEGTEQVPPRFAGCGRLFSLPGTGTCRITYQYKTEEYDKKEWRTMDGGDEHFSKLWIGTATSNSIDVEVR
jgi:hypothetical protein